MIARAESATGGSDRYLFVAKGKVLVAMVILLLSKTSPRFAARESEAFVDWLKFEVFFCQSFNFFLRTRGSQAREPR